MTQAAVAADLNQTLDVEADLTAQVTLYGVAVLDALTQLCCFFLSQILNAGVRVDTGLGQDFVGQLPSDAVDVGQADLYALLTSTPAIRAIYIYLQSILLGRVCGNQSKGRPRPCSAVRLGARACWYRRLYIGDSVRIPHTKKRRRQNFACLRVGYSRTFCDQGHLCFPAAAVCGAL